MAVSKINKPLKVRYIDKRVTVLNPGESMVLFKKSDYPNYIPFLLEDMEDWSQFFPQGYSNGYWYANCLKKAALDGTTLVRIWCIET